MTLQEAARGFAELREDRPGRFEEMAAAVLAFQRDRNSVYGRYCKAMQSQISGSEGSTGLATAGPEERIRSGAGGSRFPYLPVEAFKHAPVTTFPAGEAERVFESSGTGRGVPSRHYVKNLSIYDRAAAAHFRLVFGSGPFLIAAHLPRYRERGRTSSLLYMVEHLISRFGAEGSGFFLDDPEFLNEVVRRSRRMQVPLLVFGAAFGLLDLVETRSFQLPPEAIVIETGGMKTFRREIGREALHERLAAGFGLKRFRIRSEYGMCELLSQCYTRGEAVFHPPPWMRCTILDPEDPMKEQPPDVPGALAVIDLANVYSASALLTEDLAVRRDRGFEVLGRLSAAELRGCNFLLERV